MYKRSLTDKRKKTMRSVGEILRAKREEMGVSTKQVAESIKVREKYIIAIEKNDFSVFASSVYLKGFLKNYAKYLEIAPETIVAVYRRDTEEREENGKGSTNGASLNEKSFVLTPQMVIAFIGVVAAFALVGYLVNQFYEAQKPPELTLETPTEGATISEESIEVKGKTVVGAILKINGEAIKVENDGTFKTTLSLTPGKNTIVVRSKDPSGIGKEAIMNIQVFYETTSEESGDTIIDESGGTATDATEIVETTPDVLAVKVEIGAENAWIELDIDGEQEIARVMNAGETYEVEATETVDISTGKLSSTKFYINDIEQSFAGQSGVGGFSCKLDETEDNGFICEATPQN